MDDNKDKRKDIGISNAKSDVVKYEREVVNLAEKDPDMLNHVYREISEKLGMDAAMGIYQMFKGQQITFPVRFFNPERIQQNIISEYDGTNVRMLAVKYGYSEKTIRRMIKESTKK